MSQLTCLDFLGINDSRYLDYLAAHRDFPRTRVGKLVLTNVADWQRALAPLDASAPTPSALVDDGQPETVDAVLAQLGRRRTA